MAKKPKLSPPVTIDFETFGIEGRPAYPPIPVGVSIKWPGLKAVYYAWGHPTQNNCGVETALDALRAAWNHPGGILFHNCKFDLDVAEIHLGLPIPSPAHVHDTQFLLFLHEPNETQALKPASERLLNLKPEERDAVTDWLVEHQPVPGVKISRSPKSEHYAGRYIAYAPGDLVGVYANGDTERTEKLFNLLHKKILAAGMEQAYLRCRKLVPILLGMERRGVPVDLERLRDDVKTYQWQRESLTEWILARLKIKDPGFNLDSGDQLVEALIRAKKVDEVMLGRTPKGAWRTDKDSLDLAVTDRVLLGMLKHRTQLSTCLKTFMQPWLATAEESGGLIFTQWNQTRATDSGGSVGTRTGRFSSTPNFQNIPKTFDPIFKHDVDLLLETQQDPKERKKLETLRKTLPVCPLGVIRALPLVRSYIIPGVGRVLVDRDYSQQEPRILAHFDGNLLQQAYLENPWVDFHDYAKAELEKSGLFYERKPVKNTNLGLIYGMGVGKLAFKNDMSVEEAKRLKDAILQLYPGLKDMYKEMKRRAEAGEPIRTWGGRVYYCEPPKLVDGRMMKFDYKMVNTLVQGSAGDCTAEALIRFYESAPSNYHLLLQVHDQITVSAPVAEEDQAMEVLRRAMDEVEFTVPMLSEGKSSKTNWAELKPYDKKGKRV